MDRQSLRALMTAILCAGNRSYNGQFSTHEALKDADTILDECFSSPRLENQDMPIARLLEGHRDGIRITNILKSGDLVQVKDLLEQSAEDLLRIKGFARKSLKVLRAALADVDLHLAGEA